MRFSVLKKSSRDSEKHYVKLHIKKLKKKQNFCKNILIIFNQIKMFKYFVQSSRATKSLHKKNRRPPIQLSCRLAAFVEFFKICTIVNTVEILTQSEEAFPMTHCWHTGSIVHLSLCVTRQHTCIGGFYSFFFFVLNKFISFYPAHGVCCAHKQT